MADRLVNLHRSSSQPARMQASPLSLLCEPIPQSETNKRAKRPSSSVIDLEDDDEKKREVAAAKYLKEAATEASTCSICLCPINELRCCLGIMHTECSKPTCLECIMNYLLGTNLSDLSFLPKIKFTVNTFGNRMIEKDYGWSEKLIGKECPSCKVALDGYIYRPGREFRRFIWGYLLFQEKFDYVDWNTTTRTQSIPCRFCKKKDCCWTITNGEHEEIISCFMNPASKILAPKDCSALVLQCEACQEVIRYSQLLDHVDKHALNIKNSDTTHLLFEWIHRK